jgi:DHA2 family multidrug resistance protein
VFALPALVQGIAMGIFFVALLTIALDRIPPEKVPAASGLNNFLRIVASGFATSLTTTFWDRREAFHQSRMVESLSVFDPALREVTSSIKDLGLGDQSAAAAVLHQVVDQGYLMSSLDLFYFFGWTTLVLIVACWACCQSKGGRRGVTSDHPSPGQRNQAKAIRAVRSNERGESVSR